MHQILFDDIAKIPEGRQGRNIFLPELVLALDPDQMRKKVVAPHQPFRTAEGQIMRIVSGTVTCRINLEKFQFSVHDIQMSPPDTILELIECSDDFSMQLLVIKSLPGVDKESFRQGLAPMPMKVSLDEADWQVSVRYFELLQALLGDGYTPAAGQLILSMVSHLRHVAKTSVPKQSQRKASRGEEIFSRFLQLANEYGYKERNISFYAERLQLTPNHLSAIVRQQSGQTVLGWLTERTLTEARILLRHSSMMMYEISDYLHFSEATAFGSYFKKHTGMTPLEYRENK